MPIPSKEEEKRLLAAEAEDRRRAVSMAAALADMTGTRGWEIFYSLLGETIRDIGIEALNDDKRPKDYYQGKRDALLWLLNQVDSAIAQGKEVVDEGRAAVHFNARLGGGSIAGG